MYGNLQSAPMVGIQGRQVIQPMSGPKMAPAMQPPMRPPMQPMTMQPPMAPRSPAMFANAMRM